MTRKKGLIIKGSPTFKHSSTDQQRTDVRTFDDDTVIDGERNPLVKEATNRLVKKEKAEMDEERSSSSGQIFHRSNDEAFEHTNLSSPLTSLVIAPVGQIAAMRR